MKLFEFFDAFEKGQRKFSSLDFENLDGFSNNDFLGQEDFHKKFSK